MNKEKELKITDFYLTAYLLKQNISLKKVIKEGAIKKKVIFIFPSTPKIRTFVDKYRLNQARVKPREYSHFVEHTRDMLFSKMREEAAQ
jgi:hypothetical protein